MTHTQAIHYCQQALLLLCLCLGVTTHAAPGKRVALVIGNSSYSDRPLKNPVNDATLMQKVLRDLGFDVSVLRNVDRKSMLAGLRDFEGKARDADVALFFYAGHGAQVAGNNYLIPVNAQILGESDVPDEAVDASSVMRRIEDAKARVGLVILDACRDNPFAGANRSSTRGLARMSVPTGTIVAYATAPGSVAADGTGANGVYTEQLARHLREPGLDIKDVFDRTAQEVERITSGKQRPREEVGLRGRYVLKEGSAVPNSGVQMASVRAEPAIQPGTPAPEDEVWQAAKSANTATAYDAYLAEYPKGRYASAARIARGAIQPLPSTAASAAPVVAVQGRAGIKVESVDQRTALAAGLSKPEGALVQATIPSGPADKAGIQVGDVVIEFDGGAIQSASDLLANISNSSPGSQKSVHVVRGKRRISVSLQMGGAEVSTTFPQTFPTADRAILDFVSVDRKLPRDLINRYQISESVLAALESSTAYKSAPIGKEVELRIKSSTHVEFTGSSSKSLPKPAPILKLETRRFHAVGPCTISSKDSTHPNDPHLRGVYHRFESFTCFGIIILGMRHNDNLGLRLDELDIQGSIFPLAPGATAEVKTKITILQDNSSTSESSKCTVANAISASSLHPELTGKAWKINCDSRSGLFSTNKSTTYYLEDIGLIQSEIGDFDFESKSFIIPTNSTERVTLEATGSYGSRHTTRFEEVDLRVLPQQ